MKKENEELMVLSEVKYPVSTNEIKEFVDSWEEIPTLDPTNEDKTDYKLVKKAHLKAVNFRTSIEKTRKELKAPVIAYGKNVDAIAKEFQELINPKELELFAERNKCDQYEKNQELKRVEDERERVENIDNAITFLKMIPLQMIGVKSEAIVDIYEKIEIPIEDIYGERLDEAMIVYKDTISKLETAIEQTKLAENAQAIQYEAEVKRKAEDAEREEQRVKDREAFEKEIAEFAEIKAQQERDNQSQQEEINRQNAEREAEELAKQQKIEREEKEKSDNELYKQRYSESIKAMSKINYRDGSFDSIRDAILEAIIDGEIPNVKWEV